MINLRRILFWTLVLGLLSGLPAVPLLASDEEAGEGSALTEANSAALPDLVITELKIPPGLKAMKRVTIGVTVVNLGEESYSAGVSFVTTSVRFGGAEVLFQLPLLKSGEGVTKEIRFTFTSGRWYEVVATVDPQNEIEEFSEENNQIKERVKVSEVKRRSSGSRSCSRCGD